MENKEILTVEEAAELLDKPEQSIRRMARDKQIPAFKAAGHWRFIKVDLLNHFRQQYQPKTKEAEPCYTAEKIPSSGGSKSRLQAREQYTNLLGLK